MTAGLRLLLVEDSMRDALLAREWLREVSGSMPMHTVHVQTLAEALARLAAESWDCVLLDLNLPDGSGGVNNVRRVRGATRDVAIVVISGDNDDRTALEALRWGAQEYVVKGQFDGHSLLRVIQHALERNRVVNEIERQREHNYYHASHDSLTGLPNRSLFLDRAHEAMAQAERRGERVALCFLDLDGFKAINDSHGHAFGDTLLRAVADVLRAQVRDSDTVARVGGDEFIALLAPVRHPDEAQRAAQRIVQGIQAITTVDGKSATLGVSAGLALYPDHGGDLETLMVGADIAMYAAKRHQGGGVCLSGGIASTGGDAAPVFTTRGLTLLFQPWLDLRNGGYAGVEALVRREEARTSTAPELLSQAEAAHGLDRFGDWIVERTAKQWLAWRERNIAPGRLAINLSRSELSQPALAARWGEVLQRMGLSATQLQVEAAEHVFKEAAGGAVLGNLTALRAQGVRVVIDNFGQEEASLTLLARLPIDGVKLDKSLLHGLREGGAEARALVEAILTMARARGLEVIATGVENEDDVRNCQALNIPGAQGFWFAEPQPAKRLTTLLQGGVVLRSAANPAPPAAAD